MKAQALVIWASAAMATAQMIQHPDADRLCGRLRPMRYDPKDLPPNVRPEDLRMCLCHPLSPVNYWGYGDYLPNWVPSIFNICM
jgi:hypothetical protein